MKPELTKLNPPEKSRTYVFANNERLRYENVTAIAVSERGTHRLEYGDGRKAIVLPTFLAIELDVAEWTL